MGKKSGPEPTDPRDTSAAQTGTSLATAIANSFLSNPNEVTPDGTRTYEQTGTYTYTDPFTGQTYDVPRTTVTQTLSPEQQAIADQNNMASLNLATLGADLSGTLGQQLTGNFSLGNEETESRLFELGRKRLDPVFDQRSDDLRARLANQGITMGSEAYDREMALLGEQQNDAFNQLLLTGRGQASQELLAEDNQRINQIGALLSGGQVSAPNFTTGFTPTQAATTDNAAIIANADNAAASSYGARQAGIGSTLSGIGGLFSLSDERAKTDMTQIGETKDGLGIFSYKYKGSDRTEIGLKAQEVAKKKPKAVGARPDGLLAVNYEEALR